MIDRPSDAVARRIRDVLRAGSWARNSVLIDDEENILQAARSGVRLDGIFFSGDPRPLSAELAEVIRQHGIPVHRLTPAVEAALFGADKRARCFALAGRPRRFTLDDIARREGDIVILDGVRLAGNIGAITRTAAALGAAGIALLDSGLVSVHDRRLTRASRGLNFSFPIVPAARRAVLDLVRTTSATLVSLTPHAANPLSELAAVPGRVALLLGSERRGPSRVLDDEAAERFRVPMRLGVESLNVSVAGAIALYERSVR